MIELHGEVRRDRRADLRFGGRDVARQQGLHERHRHRDELESGSGDGGNVVGHGPIMDQRLTGENMIHSRRTFPDRPTEDLMTTAATPTPAHDAASAPIPLRERLLAWKEILETANPPKTRPLDTVGKWLVITRAAVFPMTIWSGLIGGLLAVEANRVAGGPPVDWGLFAVAVDRARAGSRREQHDQRLLRYDQRRRHRRLRPGAVCAAPDPVGLGDEAPARDRHPPGQRRRRRDHAVPRGGRAAR